MQVAENLYDYNATEKEQENKGELPEINNKKLEWKEMLKMM